MERIKEYPPLLTALVTPFRPDGEVDFPAFERLALRQIAAGAGIVVCGSTGESSALSDGEKIALFETAVALADGKVPVIAGCGSNDTSHAAALTRAAEKAGADGALHVTPYYCTPSEEGVFRHFSAVCGASELPVWIYHVPSRTGAKLSPGLLRRLAELPTVVALKDADGDLSAAADRLAACAAKLSFWSGNDDLALPYLAMGGAGLISVTSNLCPERMRSLCESALAGHRETAVAIHRRLLPLTRALFREGNPVPVKYALSLLGLCAPDCRLPLAPPSDETKAAVKNALASLGMLDNS